jgi:hypothetical protein
MPKKVGGDANGLLYAVFVDNAARRKAVTCSQFQWVADTNILSQSFHTS